MIVVAPETEAQALEERLSRGAELLFDMEQRGELGTDYERWLAHYVDLLDQFQSEAA